MKKMIMVLLGIGLLLGAIACSNATEGDGPVNASGVVDHLINEGLEADRSRDMTPADYGPLPQTATSAQVFFLPTIGEKINGHVYVFDNPEDLAEVVAKYESYSDMVKVWLFQKDNILLHLSGMVDEIDAKDYEEALNNL